MFSVETHPNASTTMFLCVTLWLVTSCIWAAKWAMPRRLAELVATATVFSHFSWNLSISEKLGQKRMVKVGSLNRNEHFLGCIQLRLRNVWGSKRFGFFLCLGYSAIAYLQETGWRENTVKNEHQRKREEQPHQKLLTKWHVFNVLRGLMNPYSSHLQTTDPGWVCIPWARCSAKPADKIGVLQTLLTFFDHTNCSFQTLTWISTNMFWKNNLRVPWTPWWKNLDLFCYIVLSVFAGSTHLDRSWLIDMKYLNKYNTKIII